MAALITLRSSTSVTPLGTLITTRGLGVKTVDWVAVLNRDCSSFTVIS